MKAILLGAGFATRLYPLTKDRPKPLLPMAGKPLIEHTMARLAGIKELDHIYVVSNHRFAGRYRNWLDTYRGPKKIELLDDGTMSPEDRLGAVGDLQFAIERARIADDLMVVAGDNLLQFDIRDLVTFFKNKGATIGLKEMGSPEEVRRFSVVQLDADGKIIEFEEKPTNPKGTLISIGVYLFPRALLGRVKEYLDAGHNPDAPGYYVEWLCRRENLYGYVMQGPWFDIADIDSYEQANQLLEQGANG